MSTAHRHTPRRLTLKPAARASALLLRLLAPIGGWLRAWWPRRIEAFRSWRRRTPVARPETGLTFEALEPRVLLSADINPAAQTLLATSSASLFTASSEPTINLTPWVDADGTAVSLDISGPGTAQLTADGDGFALRVANSDATTQITLKASGGDGRIALTGIDVSGHVGNLNLAGADLRGPARFGGKLGSLTLGDLTNAQIDIAGGGDLTLQAGKITDSQLRAPLANLALVADNGLSTSPGATRLELAALRSLTTTGDFSADVQVSGQGVSGYALGTVQVGGALAGGVWSIHGRGSSLQAGSTGSAWRANFSNTLVQFITRGDASGCLALAALQLLQIGGSARGLTLLVGADLGDDAALGGSGPAADTFKAGTLARVRITGSLIDSRLLAGLDPVNSVLGDGDDRPLGSATQRLQEFIVGGLVSGSTVVAPAFPSTVRIGGANLSPSSLAPVFARTLADTVAPVLSARLQSDTGSAAEEGVTREPALLVDLIEAGSVAAIEARFDDSGDFRAVAASLQGDGSYLIDTPALASLRGGTLPDGVYTLALRARDAAGNVAVPVSVPFTLDTTFPTLSELGLDPASDTGLLGDRRTTADRVTLIGQTEPGATVRLTQADRTVIADPSGAFRFADVALTLGNNAFDFTAADAAGNTATASLSVERTAIDSLPPTLSASLANDTGTSSTDTLTRDPTLTGQAGDNVGVTQLLVAIDPTDSPRFTDLTSLLQPDGRFTLGATQLASLAGGTLADGGHDILIRALDAAGNATTKTVRFALDTTAPTLSALSDRSTTAEIVTLEGETEPRATVHLTQGERTEFAYEGYFYFHDVPLTLGDNDFSFTLTDPAGNTGGGTLRVRREPPPDTQAPTIRAVLRTDTGDGSSDGLTSDPAITGSAADDRSVTQLFATLDPTADDPVVTEISARLAADGTFLLDRDTLDTLAGGTLAEGDHTLYLTAVDAAGNRGETVVVFTLDTTAPTLGALGLDPASDTGALGDRSTTADTVTLIGQSEPGLSVRLAQGDRTVVTDPSGAFRFADVALVLGHNAFDFTATDAAGNTATASLSIERTAIDSTAPTLTVALANDTGVSSSDALTQDPTITGQAGDNVEVTQLLVALDPTDSPRFTGLTSLLQPDGTFSLSAAQLASLAGGTLADGAHDLLIRAVDAAGNATSQTVSFTLDTAAPTLSELGLASASDTGVLGDLSTTAETVTLVGQAAPGTTVRLTQGDRTVVADPGGAFSFADVALALGHNAFDFTATDAAGNASTASLSIERTAIVVDSTAPTLTASLANDTGTSSTDTITQDPTITGQAADNVAVSQLLVAVDPTGTPSFTDFTSLLQPDGRFTLSAAQLASLAGGTLAEGAHGVLIRAVDAAGNATSQSVSFTLDTTAPGAASFGIASADTLAGDDARTSAGRVVLRGQAPAGTVVTLAAQGLSTVAAQGGTFQLANVAFAEGDNDISLTLADAAGNSRNVSRTLTRVATTHSDAVLDWNTIALQAIQRDVTDPPVATRILAIQSIAVYDTLAAIEGTPAFLVQRSVSGPVSADAAVTEAAYWVLHQLYPAQRSSFDAAFTTSLTSIADGAAKDNGLALGRSIAEAILAIRAGDGYQDFVSEDGSTAIGKWRPTGPMYLVADNPQWGSVTPFVLTSGDQFRAPPPPALDSAQYAADINEVQSLGSATSVTRTADQTEQALFWADGGGSFTPPGHWEQIAAQVARVQGNSLSANARLFAQLNVALADAAIAAWDTKYAYDAWRPETAIQNADQDGNAATTVDASWRPLLLTPPHPDYVSGHSTFSAAAASILAATFGDDVAFSTTSATLTGVTRSFTSFSQAADEAGKSRIYGGIHTSFANAAGKAIGAQVADSVLARFKLTADTQAPSVVLDDTRPAANSNVTFSGQLLDNLSGVAGAEYRIDSGELQALAFDSEGKFSVTIAFALDGSADGAHSLTIIARDAAGNIGSALTRRFVLDTRAPEISLSSLAEGDLLTAASRLAGIADGTGSSLVKLAYDLDGGTSRSLVFDSGGGFDELIHLGDLTIGDHTLHLTVQDAAGNAGTLSRSVKLAALAPFTITQVTPAGGSSDVGVTYRPQISFSRAVDAGTLNSDSLYAAGPDGSKIAATLVPALDGSFAWMFFTNPLPGASQITLHIDGGKIRAAQDGSFLDADGNGSAGGALSVSFTTVSTTTVAGTRLVGKVVDPGADLLPMTFDDIRRGEDRIIHTADDVFLNPIVHAKVFIVGRPDLVTYTDDQGNFAFDGVPVGDVKVGVDGRTATNAPDGVFWPEMVMDVTLRPGVTNTVMDSMGTTEAQLANQLRTEVYLPRVQTSALQPVSNIVPTTISVDEKSAPDLSDAQRSQLTLSVKPGSAVGADGKVLTDVKIGINTVPPELVKDMLPPGVLEHTFDITIQAPGVDVFTEPVEITFPNVFNAAPGTKLNILSFDHTTGRLVINGTATVSADGQTVTSDEGSGVRAPGWHVLDVLVQKVGEAFSFEKCDDFGDSAIDTLKQASLASLQTSAALISTVDLMPWELIPVVGGLGDAQLSIGRGVVKGLAESLEEIAKTLLGEVPGAAADVIRNDELTREQRLSIAKSLTSAGISITFGPFGLPVTVYLDADAYNRDVQDAMRVVGRDLPEATARLLGSAGACLGLGVKTGIEDVAAAFERIKTRFDATIAAMGTVLNTAVQIGNLVGKLRMLLNEPSDLPFFVSRGDLVSAIDSMRSIIGATEIARSSTLRQMREDYTQSLFQARSDLFALLSHAESPLEGAFYSVDGEGPTIRGSVTSEGRFTIALAPAISHTISFFDPNSGLAWSEIFPAGQSGTIVRGKFAAVSSGTETDSDADGLSDFAETIIGTRVKSADSDLDGVSDYGEVLAGTNPLDGRPAATGVLATLPLQGRSEAVSADQPAGSDKSLAVVATGTYGVAFIDVARSELPLLHREVDLPGDSTDVSVDGALGIAAVASNAGGLNLVDLAGTVRNVAINASSVEVADGIAYANNGGELRAYDLLTGDRLQTLALGVSPIVSMAREGQMLYTVDAAHTLRAVDISSGRMVARGSLLLPTAAAKLFVGGGIAYIGAGDGVTGGFMTAKVTSPDALTLLSGVDSNGIAGTAIAATGSGIGVAVGSSVVNGFRSLDLLDLSDPTNTAGIQTRINLPQVPYDVSIAAGLAFVADGTGGLQVVNYRAFDNRGVAPTVGATTSLIDVDPIKPGLQVQEGGRVVVTPTVTDDVQVRNVELLVGGKVVRNDLSFPFDLTGALPTIAASGGTNVTLQVRATDTGGNFGLSAPIEVELVPDTFGPLLLGNSLKDGATVGRSFRAVTLDFSESIDPLTLGASAIQIVDADGTAVNPDNLQFRLNGRQLHATFAPLAVGAYTLRIDTAQVKDRAGNAVGAAMMDTRFTVKQFSVEWINPAGGDWNTAANWSTGVVPLASDDVFIGLPENVTVTISGGTVKVASLVSNENLVLAGGTLDISGEARIDGSFRMSAGTLSGTGTLLLAGTGNQWSGGAMSGGGTTRIGLGADLVVTGDNLKFLGDRTLVNEGTLIDESTAARVELDGVIAFNNNGLFDIRGNQAWRNTAGPAAMTLNNAGTMRKSAGTGVFLFTNTVLNNAGTVDAQAGRLVFSGGGGTSSGAFMTSAGAAIELEGGTQTWLAGAHATGSGAIVVGRANTSIDGMLSIDGDVSAERLDLNFGGTLTGAGTLTITGTGSQWTAGVMTGGGTTRIAPAADLSLTGAARKALVNRRIFNEGTLIDAQTAGGYVELDGSGVLDNAGLFDIRSDQSWENHFFPGGTLTLNNSGTLRKSLGAGDFQFLNTALNNTGTVDVQAGRLAFGGDGGVSTGNFTTAAGTALVFQTGTQTWQSGARASGSGAIELGSLGIEAGTLAVEGSAEVNRLDITAGTLTGAGTLTLTGLGSQWLGGTMTGGGTTRIAPTADLSLTGAARKTLVNRRLFNEGTLIDAQTPGSYVELDGSGVLDNTGLFDIRGDQSWESHFAPAGTLALNNSGTLRKSLGAGDFQFLNTALNNTGTVDVQAGRLAFGGDGGVSTGNFTTAAGTAIVFQTGTQTWQSGARASGSGAIELGSLGIEAGTLAVEGSAEVNRLDITAGTLTGAGTLTLTGLGSQWLGGTMTGGGTTRMAAAAELTVGGSQRKILGNRTIQNEGTLIDAQTAGGYVDLDGSGVLDNAGLFDIRGDEKWENHFFPAGTLTLNNRGNLRKSAGPGDFVFSNVSFTNAGTVTVLSGILKVGSVTYTT